MATVSAYARPASIDEALKLLESPDSWPLGGGTKVNPAPSRLPVVLVDLQGLGLEAVSRVGDKLSLGATATLQGLVDQPDVPAVVREAARREQPSTLRAQATIGGCVATGDHESELLAVLLVHAALVRLAGPAGVDDLPLEDVLAALPMRPGTIITSVTIETGGLAAVHRTGRTIADKPIVVAAGRTTPVGTRLALAGVAPTPVLVTSAEGLEPPGDFRGSAEYRRALAAVLLARVLEEIGR